MLGRDKLTYNMSKDWKFIKVDANTLDKIIHSTEIKEENIKWIKIDVEVEYEVIKRAINILSKEKITILIEVHYLDEIRIFIKIWTYLKSISLK
jgi:FkbM family methyltransferase